MDITNTRRTIWVPKWGASGSQFDFGHIDNCTSDLRLILAPRTSGTVGGIVLGHWIIGLEGTVTVEAREVTANLQKKMLPWYDSGDSISLTPALNTDLYTYANLLTLHPQDMGEDDKQDINLLKAVPLWTPPAGDGNSSNRQTIRFIFYPDRDQLEDSGELVYGYVGPVPTSE